MDIEQFAGEPASVREPTWDRLQFKGDGSEFFRIWIVNLFLTILTLGIYAAWAKVRTNQYFYANTEYKGGTFEYLADPRRILFGNLIIAGFILLYVMSSYFSPEISLLILLLFGVFFPYLIYKSLRFRARNTAYRNIRFSFSGTAGKAYTIYFGYMILNALSFGMLFPYVAYRRKGYLLNNLHFGNTDGQFKGDVGFFFKTYFLAALVGGAIAFFLAMGLAIAIGITMASMGPMDTSGEEVPTAFSLVFILAGLSFYLVIILLSTLYPLYIFKEITNHTMERTSVGPFHLKADLEFKKLLWIRLTNLSLIVLTLGLYTPWAKVRRYRYITERMEVLADEQDFAEIFARTTAEVESLGESAADIFDFDVGFGL